MTTPALTIPLTGRALIEASAGTGKTWTLTGIILRLLIEGGYEPRGIIATTFTRKAAAEMQQRVQKRLHALRENLKTIASGYFHDETLLADDAGLAARLDAITTASGGDDINRHLIRHAVKKRGLNGLIALFARVESLQEHLDEIFIGTIDSLCQRWLAEFALETGNDERLQINENSPALEETVHDALRRLRHAEYLADPDTFARRIAQGGLHDSDDYLAAAREATTYRDATIDSDNPKTDSDDSPATYDSEHHAALVQQLRALDAAVIADWHALITAPAFMAITNARAAWKAHTDHIPTLLHQLRNETPLDTDTTAKLAEGILDPKINKSKTNDALAAAYSTHPLTTLLRDLLAARDAQQQHHAHRTRQTTKQLLDTVRDEYPAALEARGETTFSEKTRRINQTLAHERHGASLARYIMQRYPVMLVDESQDLNDEQATLLEHTWLRDDADRTRTFLLLVGDPKQAIYAFRGGDVANYNRLKQHFTTAEQHRLDTNRRSSPHLIAALNEHYLQGDNARLGEHITYHRAQAANPAPTIVSTSGDPIARPMQWYHSGTNNGEETDAIAALVAHLLAANSPWARRNADGSLARIRPGDIQILTRGNDSLAELQTKLHARHIDSELNHDRSVFGGTVARTFADLLAAIEQPDQRDRQNRLLSGHYYGYSQTELDRLAAIEQGSIAARADELTLADLRDALTRAQDDWQNRGLLAALNPLLTHRKHNIWQTLASYPAPDNLRHLLDLRHIQTIIAEHAPGQRPAQFAAWWRDQLAAPPDADWAKAPPLPGDDAVRLLTIHKAKGLESPITILATGGVRRGGDNRARIKTWRYRDGGCIRITLDKPEGDIETHIKAQENDENRRLLYVGLTRAKNLLLVAHREKHGIESTEKLYQTYAQNPGQCPHADEIPIFITNSPAELPPPPQRSAAGEGWGGGSANIPGTAAETTTALPPPADLPPPPQDASASAAGEGWGGGSANIPGTAAETTTDVGRPFMADNNNVGHKCPTYDTVAITDLPPSPCGRGVGGGVRLHTAHAESSTITNSPTALPPPPQRSAAGEGWGGGSANIPGTATEITPPQKTWRTRFHGWQRSSFSALLRDAIEPTSPDLADYAVAEHQTAPDAPADADIRYTYPRGTAPGSALHAVLEHTRPDHRDDWRRHLDHENQQWQLGLEPAQLDACETWLDAIYHSTLPQSGITLGDSKRGNHRSEYNFTLGSDDRAPLPVARINRLLTAAGYPLNLHQHHRHIRYIRGEIDHIYQHDGRYYILDYKTNHLGNHPDDYTPAKIREAMNDHHYWLQAALYQVALHRLLKTRLPDYDPARHLGGIEYHYLRGIDPAHPTHGTYGWNYPPDFIAELDHILGNNPA